MNPLQRLRDRRSLLKGVSLGASGLLFAPLWQKVAAAVDGDDAPPKRAIFFLFDNGFHERGSTPVGMRISTSLVRQESIQNAKLPADIEPFAPFQDRMTIVQGLQGRHCAMNHGSGFGALTGLRGVARPAGESIDVAFAHVHPGIFPLITLGVAAGKNTQTAYVSSAWGLGSPIATQCRPELAYESLFGSLGATRNDFLARKNLLDFVARDVRRMQARVAGPEKELVDHHLAALESLSRRDEQLARPQEGGTLRRHVPQLPAAPARRMTELAAAQCDLAAAALISGLTNVVTITSGLCGLGTDYSGLTSSNTHEIGHGTTDRELGVSGMEVLSRYRKHLAQQAARLLTKLHETREGHGTMLDNTVLVFTSDSANTQHCNGSNWPFVLVGNLGGQLKAGQYVSYPLSGDGELPAVSATSNPAINALYCTLLHAAGKPRDRFNAGQASPDQCGPLTELLAS